MNTLKLKAFGFVLTVSIAVMFVCVFCPAKAMADDAIAYSVDSSGNYTNYTSVDAAISDGYSGKTIVMKRDWALNQTLGIADSKKITIDMNGHRIINNGSSTVIRLYEHAELKLFSTSSKEISFTGFNNNNGDKIYSTVVTGGLVTGGKSDSGAGGIWAENWTKLTLDNVDVVGNEGGCQGGGIRIDKESHLCLNNGASVKYNKAEFGGGVHVDGADSDVRLDNKSSVEANLADGGQGGGIYCYKDGARIHLEGSSCIKDNRASLDGGGVYFQESYVSVSSDDRTGIIRGNSSDWSGGAICFRGNHDGCFGCKVQENHSEYTGGAFRFEGHGSDHTIKDCTITGNWCNGKGENYEGGGVFVVWDNNVTLNGKVIIKGNTRGKGGSPDDLFLDDTWIANAYIEGGVDSGSSVGVRTGSTGASRKIGKNISTYSDGTYFMDLDGGYYVSREGSNLYQRKR